MPAADQPLLGKKVSDLVEDGAQVLLDGSVDATLKYVDDFTEYWPGNAEMQKGHFFPAMLQKKGTTLKTETDGQVKEQSFPDDQLLVIRVPKQDMKVKIEVDDQPVTTLDFSTARLADQ